MARREVLDEEPFDIDLGDEKAEVIDLAEDDEDEDDEPEEPRGRREKGTVKRTAADDDGEDGDDDSGDLSDDDLDSYAAEREDLRARTIAAESAAREAKDIAAAVVQKLETNKTSDAKAQLTAKKAEITKAVAEKRKALKAAFEEGDADKHSQLTEELADLKGQEKVLAVIEENLSAQEKMAATTPRRTVAEPHPKAKAWLAKRPWFHKNEEARMLAVLAGNRLEQSGVTPDSDDYYKQVDQAVKRRFPELYERDTKPKRDDTPPVRGVERTENSRTRESGKVRLSPLQVRIARQWGIPPKEMARQVLEQRKRDEGAR